MPYGRNFRGAGHVFEPLAQSRCPAKWQRGVEPTSVDHKPSVLTTHYTTEPHVFSSSFKTRTYHLNVLCCTRQQSVNVRYVLRENISTGFPFQGQPLNCHAGPCTNTATTRSLKYTQMFNVIKHLSWLSCNVCQACFDRLNYIIQSQTVFNSINEMKAGKSILSHCS